MTVAIVGSRKTNMSRDAFARLADDLIPKELGKVERIVSGGAYGIDSLAAWYARYRGYKLIEYLPDYSIFGRRAPIIRNMDIIRDADFVLAFWDGESRGTLSSINMALESHKPLLVYYTLSGTARLFTPPRTEQEHK